MEIPPEVEIRRLFNFGLFVGRQKSEYAGPLYMEIPPEVTIRRLFQFGLCVERQKSQYAG